VSARRTWAAVAALLFVLVAAGTVGRTLRSLNVAGQPDVPRFGMQDFRDGIYYPAVALHDGRNPYDVPDYTSRYPVGRKFPLFAPAALLVYLPLAFLPQDGAAVVFLLGNLALTLALAALVLGAAGIERTAARVFGVAALIVASHPGQMALYIGQGAVYFAIGLVLAFTLARTRPGLAGMGLALVCLKPTVGVPAALLLTARSDRRALSTGLVVAALSSLVVLPFLVGASGGVGPFVGTLVDNYSRWGQDAATKVTESVHRLDAFLLVGRALGRPLTAAEDLVVTGAVLGVAIWAVWRARRFEDPASRPLSTSVMVAAILVAFYHQAYDALFLALPLAFAARGAWGRSTLARVCRVLVLGAGAVLAGNYVATQALIDRLGLTGAAWTAVTSVNAIAMLAVFTGCVAAALGARGASATPALSVRHASSTVAA
jgi:Glycosyltransferase family 87